jgi:group I intron endonuclease
MEEQTNKGIYKITCLATGKFYIGSSVNLKRRKYIHFRELQANVHNNKHLQFSYNKYGKDSFIFEVIEYLPATTDWNFTLQTEQKYLDELMPWDSKIGYNQCKNVGSPGGQIKRTCSAETRARMSEVGKGRPKTEEFKQTLSKMYKGKSMKERTNDLNWSSSKKGKTMKEITNNPDWIDSKVGKPRPQWLKQKLSEERKGEKNPMFGKRFKRSSEQIAAQTGENNHMFGKNGNKHHNFDPAPILLVNKVGETAAKTRFEWRSEKVDINAILNYTQQSSKGWSLPS